jgi:hypothetical protein
MHHRLALFDRELLVTGSQDWTRRVAERNHEDSAVTGEAGLVRRDGRELERLRELFGG